MQEVSFQVNSKTITGLRWHRANKPLMIAVHGWLDNANSFLSLASHQTDFDLIAIDLPGHGLSSHRSNDAHYHFVDWVQDLYELFEQQQWSSVCFVGHSMGGIIGAMFAACFPEKVSSLICIEALGPLVSGENTTVEQLQKSIKSRARIKDKQLRLHQSLESAIKARADAGRFSFAIAEQLVVRNIQQVDGGYRWRTDQRLRTMSSLRMTETQASNILQAISCKTLVILGQQGYEGVSEAVGRRLSELSIGHLVKLPGGHHLHMEHPEQVAMTISKFFAGE